MGFAALAPLPANWTSLSVIDKAIAQIRSAEAMAAPEGMLWGGTCDPQLWGYDVCRQALSITRGGDPSSVVAALNDWYKYGKCWPPELHTPEACAEAERLYKQGVDASALAASFVRTAPVVQTHWVHDEAAPATLPLVSLPTTPLAAPAQQPLVSTPTTPAWAARLPAALTRQWIPGVSNWITGGIVAVAAAALLRPGRSRL